MIEELLAGRAWCEVALCDIPLTEILRSLRRDIGHVTRSELSVKSTEEARKNTLSHLHGKGRFPHHTDFAFRAMPPRVIVLVNDSSEDFERPTLVASAASVSDGLRLAWEKSFWTLATREGSFVVSGRFRQGANEGYRWDRDFLRPANFHAERCVRELPNELMLGEVACSWKPNTALLIDNWNCTHGRGALPLGGDDTGQRVLTRYEVWQHAGLD